MVRRRIFKVVPTCNCLVRFGMMKVDRRTSTEESQPHDRDEANGDDAGHRLAVSIQGPDHYKARLRQAILIRCLHGPSFIVPRPLF